MYPHLFTLDCEIKTSISLESFAQVVYLHYMFCVDSICVLVLKGYVHQYRTHTRKCGVFWWWTLQDQPKDLLETLQVVTLYPKTSDIDSKPVDCKPCKRIGAGLIQTEWTEWTWTKWTRSQQRCAETFTSGLASRSTLAFVLVQLGSTVSCSE